MFYDWIIFTIIKLFGIIIHLDFAPIKLFRHLHLKVNLHYTFQTIRSSLWSTTIRDLTLKIDDLTQRKHTKHKSTCHSCICIPLSGGKMGFLLAAIPSLRRRTAVKWRRWMCVCVRRAHTRCRCRSGQE